MSDNIQDDEVFTKINKGIGMFEEGALRMHLYLTCIESLARMLTGNNFLTFGSWISAKKEPYRTEKDNIKIDENLSNEKIAKKFSDSYNSIHGTRTMFYYFFTNGLTVSQKEKLAENMLVIESNPLPKVYHIFSSFPSGKKSGNSDLDMVEEKNSLWKEIKIEVRLELIAKALYKVRNHFTHSLIPYTSVQDKKGPFPTPTDGILNRGDTVFVWNENIAIGSNMKPMNYYLKETVLLGLKNYILKVKEDNNR